MKYGPYSYSRQSTYYSCPNKFKLTYIDKIFITSDSYALKKGSWLHESIENILLGSKIKQPKDMEPEESKECKTILKGFLESDFFKSILHLSETYEMKVEEGVGFDEHFNIVPYNEASFFRGFIDLHLYSEKKCIIIDWKSGKLKSLENQDFLQNEIYALWFLLKNPEVWEVSVVFFYLEHNRYNRKIITRDDIGNLKNKIYKRIEKIEDTEDFKKTITKLCGYCDYLKDGYCELSDSELLSVL